MMPFNTVDMLILNNVVNGCTHRMPELAWGDQGIPCRVRCNMWDSVATLRMHCCRYMGDVLIVDVWVDA